jgi:hypothetical protein
LTCREGELIEERALRALRAGAWWLREDGGLQPMSFEELVRVIREFEGGSEAWRDA